MKSAILILIATFIQCISGCAQQPGDRVVGGPCDGCEIMFEGMPEKLKWQTTIAGPDEPGERLLIDGTIYLKDGKTPASGVILYVYHTDNKGLYTPDTDQTKAKRHGHLRGWMKTNDEGRYQFSSIRPASYPNRNVPQHIHPLIKEPGKSLYWIDEYLFEDDPLLTGEERSRQQNRGGKGIVMLKKNSQGVWIGHRDIVLGLNIPNY